MTSDSQIERSMSQASRQIETTMSLVRGVLIGIVFVRLVGIRGAEFGDGHIKHIIALSSLALGFLLSLAIVVVVRRIPRPAPLLVASALLDMSIAFVVVMPSVVWPHANYLGVLRAPDFAVWPLAVAVAGVRLSRATAIAGLAAALVAVTALIGMDLTHNRDIMAYNGGDAVMAYALLLTSGILAIRLSSWVRSLVLSTAESAGNAARARQVLGAYVSEEVALLVQDGSASLGGEKRDVAVLFSDLRGFTYYSVSAEPSTLIFELNEYFETMVAVIRQNGGVVDKYIGDSIMVVFGIPEHRGDEATRAVRTAAAMQSAFAQFNRARESRGLPAFQQGIGIHYGPVVAGNVGTLERLQYTVIGDTVNFASRLESATKELGVQVLLSADVVQRAADEGCSLVLDRLADIEVRGRPGRHVVFSVPQ